MFEIWAMWPKYGGRLILFVGLSFPPIIQATPPMPFLSQTLETLQNILQKDFKQPIQLIVSPCLHLPNVSVQAKMTIKDVHFDPCNKKFHANINILNPPENQLKPFVLTGHVQFLRSVPVLRETLTAGQAILPDMVDWKLLTDDYRLKDAIPTKEELQGSVSKCTLLPGDILKWKNLKTLSQIERGALVEIVYRTAGLQVVLQGGRALANGRKGDTIPVSNPRSSKNKKPLFAIVENHRQVCINPTGIL